MGSESAKKVKFILAWYNLEKNKLSPEKKILLLNRWIISCRDFEEYEMAESLKQEKIKVIREIRVKKKGKRTFFNRIALIAKIIIRKWRTSKDSKRGFQNETGQNP